MKRFLLLVCLLILPLGAFAQSSAVEEIHDVASANKVLEQARYALERGDFRAAMDDYVKVAQSGFGEARVWFNAGTSAYRAGDVGHSVLYYNRALRADPGYDRARQSLAVVSPATNDAGSGFFSQVVDTSFRRLPPIALFIAAEVLFVIGCFAMARAFAIVDRDRRGHWIATLSWAFVLCAICAGIGVADHQFRSGGKTAVILSDKTVTRSEPRADSTAQLELPAGTMVELTEDPQRGFVRCKLADGRSGYVSLDQIERV